jgi:hypothetical protein
MSDGEFLFHLADELAGQGDAGALRAAGADQDDALTPAWCRASAMSSILRVQVGEVMAGASGWGVGGDAGW